MVYSTVLETVTYIYPLAENAIQELDGTVLFPDVSTQEAGFLDQIDA